jgi:hypothetical protein
MKVVMPKQFEIKNSAGVAPEGTSHRNLAALCNAGGLDGLRSIHDRPRPNKVSIEKKESCLRGATSRESIYARSVAKNSAWVPGCLMLPEIGKCLVPVSTWEGGGWEVFPSFTEHCTCHHEYTYSSLISGWLHGV